MKFWSAILVCAASALLSCAAYADAPMTQQQGEAILKELREIGGYIEERIRQKEAARSAGRKGTT